MIILSERALLKDGQIRFPAYLRAPLSLRKGTRCYSVVDKKRSAISDYIEIITTTLAPDLWKHLWRIEIVTEDQVGNSLILFELLESRGLNIVAFESTINSITRYHTTHIIVSARRYSCNVDGTPNEREASNAQELPELRREMLAYLGDQIAIPPHKVEPMVKIRRMNLFRQLMEQIEQDERFFSNRGGVALNGDCLHLPTRTVNHLQNKLGSGRIFYSSSADTKVRVLKTVVFNQDAYTKYRGIIFFNSNEDSVVTPIYTAFSDCGFNIIQQQMRPVTRQEQDRLVREAGYNPGLFTTDLNRIDILFEASDRPAEQTGPVNVRALQSHIDEMIERRGMQSFVHMLIEADRS